MLKAYRGQGAKASRQPKAALIFTQCLFVRTPASEMSLAVTHPH